MPGVSRVNTDSAGGTIIGALAPTVYVNGQNIVCQGSDVQGHGTGAHASPTMTDHSSTVKANGILICRAGDAASCGHAASGSSTVFAG
jgi:uncharacterized Zn-binding protein involved in type VI secretion